VQQSADDSTTSQLPDTPKPPHVSNTVTTPNPPIKLESIKLSDQVPPRFKKYLGKTWMELLKDTEYVKFFKEKGHKDMQPVLDAAITQYQTMMKEFDDGTPDSKIVI